MYKGLCFPIHPFKIRLGVVDLGYFDFFLFSEPRYKMGHFRISSVHKEVHLGVPDPTAD